MTGKSHYQVFGVPADASAAQIKQAYRRLAQQLHPDHNPDPGAEEEFKKLLEAYKVLSNPEKRAAYDRALALTSGNVRSPGDSSREPFGTRLAKRERGADLLFKLKIPLAEVVSGARILIDLPRFEPCPDCDGSGERRQGACRTCRATGRMRVKRRLEVKVPPGIEDDSRIQLTSEGDCGVAGGAPGDLFVAVAVQPHPLLRRRGHQLLCEVPIPFPLAALGGDIELPTPEGSVQLVVPAGTQSGQVLRVRGKGLPRLKSKARGDPLATVQVEMPAKLNAEMRGLLQEFLNAAGDKAFPRSRQFQRLVHPSK